MFAAVLSPSSAAGYKYTIPNPIYAELVGGVGIGDDATFGVLRYTDIAFLSNALREFAKLRKDIFYTGRTATYYPIYQNTNTLTRILKSPYNYISQPTDDDVNFASASWPIPDFLDADKDLSAQAALPANFSGNIEAAYPAIANVTQTNGWTLQTRLFTDLAFSYTNRVAKLSTITNAYWSLAKLHRLKFLNYSTPSSPSGWHRVDAGTNTDIDYYTRAGDEDQNWIQDGPTVTTNWYNSVSAGYLQYVGYHYSYKRYQTSWTTNGLTVSPLCSTINKFDVYTHLDETSSIPQTVVLAQPIEKVWVARNSYYGSDMSWEDRIDEYKRVSLFKIERNSEEKLPATGTQSGAVTNESSTTYVLVDTSEYGGWITNTYTNSYVGEYNLIYRGLTGLGSTQNFMKGLLSAAQLNDLNRECRSPRVPHDDGYGYPDFYDTTVRTVWYRVSYMWSLTTIKPNYTCTFDGK